MCTVNKGICGERMVWCRVAAGCINFMQVVSKCVSISEDPQAKKRVGIANKEDNCRDVCVVLVTTTEYDLSY